MQRKKRGFTLIELLVVIAIIAILAAILFPVFIAAKKKAQQSSCQSNMKQIAMAMQRYIDDNSGCFPDQAIFGWAYTGAGIDAGAGGEIIRTFSHRYRVMLGPDTYAPAGMAKVLWPYLKNLNVYKCPSELRQRPSTAPTWLPADQKPYECLTSYYYKHALCWIADVQRHPVIGSTAKYPSKLTLFYEEAWHGEQSPWFWNGDPTSTAPFKPTSAIFFDLHVGRIEVPKFDTYGYDGNWYFYTGASRTKMDYGHNREFAKGGRDIF